MKDAKSTTGRREHEKRNKSECAKQAKDIALARANEIRRREDEIANAIWGNGVTGEAIDAVCNWEFLLEAWPEWMAEPDTLETMLTPTIGLRRETRRLIEAVSVAIKTGDASRLRAIALAAERRKQPAVEREDEVRAWLFRRCLKSNAPPSLFRFSFKAPKFSATMLTQEFNEFRRLKIDRRQMLRVCQGLGIPLDSKPGKKRKSAKELIQDKSKGALSLFRRK